MQAKSAIVKMMKEELQPPLPLGFITSYSVDNFYVSPCNAKAYAYAHRWRDWAAPMTLVITPPKGGKTHLCHIFAQLANCAVLEGLEFGSSAVRGEALALDNINDSQFSQEALFHLTNRALQKQIKLFMSASLPPDRWPKIIPDLRSRLLSAAVFFVENPDENMLAPLLVKLFADLGLRPSPEVISFLVARVPRNYEAICKIVQKMDEIALNERAPAIHQNISHRVSHKIKGINIAQATKALQWLMELPQDYGQDDITRLYY